MYRIQDSFSLQISLSLFPSHVIVNNHPVLWFGNYYSNTMTKRRWQYYDDVYVVIATLCTHGDSNTKYIHYIHGDSYTRNCGDQTRQLLLRMRTKVNFNLLPTALHRGYTSLPAHDNQRQTVKGYIHRKEQSSWK